MENTIDDATLKAAIRACRPFTYLDDLKRDVAAHLGNPGLHDGNSGRDSFGYRVYRLNEQVDKEETAEWLSSNGFTQANEERLAAMVNGSADMVVGINSMFGRRIITGRIKPDGRGYYLFIPKGKRTKGYWPGYIRPAQECGQPSLPNSLIVVGQS